MIINTNDGQSFETNRDLSASERHILQKLFAWESMATSLEQFREKKKEALHKGWNNSGPVTESSALKAIIKDLERKVSIRIDKIG